MRCGDTIVHTEMTIQSPASLGRAVLHDEFGESAVAVWDASRSLQVIVPGFEVRLDGLLAITEEAVR